MRAIVIAGHSVPVWIVAFLLMGTCAGAVATYIVATMTIPVEIKEPIEVLSYPTQISLYPGDSLPLVVTVKNNAQLDYVVNLLFSLSNATYSASYVTFNDTEFTVHPGNQNLAVLMQISGDAPAANVQLTVQVQRSTIQFMESFSVTVTDVTFGGLTSEPSNYIAVTLRNTGTGQVILDQVKVNDVIRTFYTDPTIINPADSGITIMVANVGWVIGNPYKIDLIDSTGQTVGSYQKIAGP